MHTAIKCLLFNNSLCHLSCKVFILEVCIPNYLGIATIEVVTRAGNLLTAQIAYANSIVPVATPCGLYCP